MEVTKKIKQAYEKPVILINSYVVEDCITASVGENNMDVVSGTGWIWR